MENTLENKAKFFAQYYGQEVVTCDSIANYKILIDNGLVDKSVIWLPNEHEIENLYLELTPLEQISDEDAKAIGCESAKSATTTFIKSLSNDRYDTDFLRSKGYAVPYMGLSVEQLVKYGWVKLK